MILQETSSLMIQALLQQSVTVDNLQPEIISVAWSTDNLSKILFDNVTGDNLTDELVVRYLDNVTLNFETSERMVDFPKVLINGIEKTASKQIVNGNTDTQQPSGWWSMKSEV